MFVPVAITPEPSPAVPAPFHPILRGRAGPNLLAEVMAKFGLHLPLHRQSWRFAHEGAPPTVLLPMNVARTAAPARPPSSPT